MTDVFDQDAAPRVQRRSTPPRQPSGWQAIGDEELYRILDGVSDGEDPRPYLPAADPDPKEFSTAAEHTAAYIEQKNYEHRMEQLWRNIRGAVYLSNCGVAQTGIDQYLAANKARDASPARHRLWRVDAWMQRNLWDVILVLLALLTLIGFAIVAVPAEINEDTLPGFLAFLLGILGMTAEVIRRGNG